MEHYQVLADVGWTKENYNKLLVDSGVLNACFSLFVHPLGASEDKAQESWWTPFLFCYLLLLPGRTRHVSCGPPEQLYH